MSLEAAFAFWKSFDLDGRKGQLSEASLEVAARQDAGAHSRAQLITAIKLAKQEHAAECSTLQPLVKCFQEEVDSLTIRSRAAEKLFFLYVKELAEAPDPSGGLSLALELQRAAALHSRDMAQLKSELAAARSASAGAATDAAAECDRLRKEVAALESELSSLSSQDILVRQLEGRLESLEAEIEQQVAQRLAARESEMRKVLEEEIESVREAETAAEARAANLRQQLADAVSARDEAQRAQFALRTRLDDDAAGRTAQIEALQAENAKLQGQLMALSLANEELTRRVAAAQPVDGSDGASGGGGGGSGANASNSNSGSGSSDGHVFIADPLHALRVQVDAQRSRAVAAESECARLSASVTSAQEEARRWGELLDVRSKAHDATVAELHSRLGQRDVDLAALRSELLSRPSHAEVSSLRQQVAVLQAMHFNGFGGGNCGNGGEGEDGGAEEGQSEEELSLSRLNSSSNSGGGGGGGSEVLEVTTLLLKRIRGLEARALRAEAARAAAVQEAADAQRELEASAERISDLRQLVNRLEEELARFSQAGGHGGGHGAGHGGTSSVTASVTPRKGEQLGPTADVSIKAGGLLSPAPLPSFLGSRGGGAGAGGGAGGGAQQLTADAHLQSILLGAAVSKPGDALAAITVVSDDGNTNSGSGSGSGGGAAQSADGSMVVILRAQRDRFRARMLELEAELSARTAAATEAESRASKLSSDNMRMYEKIRYLQSLLGGGGAGGGSAGGAEARINMATGTASGSGGSDIRSRQGGGSGNAVGGGLGDDDFERPYRQQYNEALDPFADFSKAERAKRIAKLNAVDSVLYTGSRLFLSSKAARLFIFGYVVVLHLLVFLTLSHFARVTHGSCDDDHLPSAAAGLPAAAARLPGM